MHELVIFDCDGVLVDSEVISNEVLARTLTREGLPTTLSQARRDYPGLLLTVVGVAQSCCGLWVNVIDARRDLVLRAWLSLSATRVSF
jgi:phosphoglycolate phosphatase-like HAD superfamily hydrolase